MLSTYNYNGLILSLQTYESLLPQNAFIEWLLNKNDLDNNIFDESALEEDITIFEILLPYLLKYKDTLFPRLLPEDKSNVFHFSARKNKYISIYFYYKLFYNYNNNCLDIYDNKGDTPLLIACYFSSYESSSVLIELGADINKQNKHYLDTPLHKAIESNMENIAKKLIIYGANVNIENKNGNTPYTLACNINNTELMNALSNHCCIIELMKCDTKISSLRNTKYHLLLMILLSCVI
jgi:ankyrin repeat protein